MEMTAQEMAEKIMSANKVEDLGPIDYRPIPVKDKWAERLWPCMAWSIFAFNLVIAAQFLSQILFIDSSDYHWARHLTIVVTFCGSYMFLVWTHNNILRDKNG